MKSSKGCMCALLLFPMIGNAGPWEDLRAEYRATPDLPTRARIVREANAPQVGGTAETVATNARPAIIVAMESNYLAVATAAGVKGKTPMEADAILTAAFEGENDTKKAGRIQNAALRLAVLRAEMRAVGIDPDRVTGAAFVVTTNSAPVIGPSIAESAIGRPATADDLK